MQAKMDVVRGAKTKEIRLRLPSIVGRGADSKIKLPASTVSRHHCEIYEYEGQVVVRDLGSSNGTVVNGHKIKGPTFLTPEDQLTIGPVTVHVSKLPEVQLSASHTFPVASENDAAPSFDELPAEETIPVAATDSEIPLVTERPELTEDKDDGSVLEYAEPKSTGRSFVGIAPAENAIDPVSESPVFEVSGEEEKPTIDSDESALNQFFNNLDNDR